MHNDTIFLAIVIRMGFQICRISIELFVFPGNIDKLVKLFGYIFYNLSFYEGD